MTDSRKQEGKSLSRGEDQARTIWPNLAFPHRHLSNSAPPSLSFDPITVTLALAGGLILNFYPIDSYSDKVRVSA